MKFSGQLHAPSCLLKDRFWSERRKREDVLFVSRFALQYMLANFIFVAADRNKLNRKDIRNIGSVWETYI